MSFPERIQVPVVVAAGLQFEGELTARDQSIMLLVAWFAGIHGLDAHGMVDVPDLDMRKALGGLRTIKADRSDGYYARLSNATIRSDERLPDMADGVAAPVVIPGMRRVTINRAHRWQVDQALVDSFKLHEGEAVVEIPMNLLAGARCKFTLPLFLRAMAWQAGDVDKHWIHRRRTKAIEYKLSLADLQEAMGVDYPAAIMERTVLGPAIREIEGLTDVAVEYMSIAKPGMESKRARAFIIMVGMMEQIVYAPARRPRSFAEIGKPEPGRVIPFTMPFSRASRKVLPPAPPPADDEDEDDLPPFMRTDRKKTT